MTTSVTLPSDRQPEKLSDEELLEAGREVLRHEAEELVRAAARFGMELVQAAREKTIARASSSAKNLFIDFLLSIRKHTFGQHIILPLRLL